MNRRDFFKLLAAVATVPALPMPKAGPPVQAPAAGVGIPVGWAAEDIRAGEYGFVQVMGNLSLSNPRMSEQLQFLGVPLERDSWGLEFDT